MSLQPNGHHERWLQHDCIGPTVALKGNGSELLKNTLRGNNVIRKHVLMTFMTPREMVPPFESYRSKVTLMSPKPRQRSDRQLPCGICSEHHSSPTEYNVGMTSGNSA